MTSQSPPIEIPVRSPPHKGTPDDPVPPMQPGRDVEIPEGREPIGIPAPPDQDLPNFPVGPEELPAY